MQRETAQEQKKKRMLREALLPRVKKTTRWHQRWYKKTRNKPRHTRDLNYANTRPVGVTATAWHEKRRAQERTREISAARTSSRPRGNKNGRERAQLHEH